MMARRAKWAAMAAVLLLTSCGFLTNEQTQAALGIIDQMELQQSVTAEQAEALRQALLANTGEPWWQQLGRVVLEVGLAVAGVRLWRGPAASIAERAARTAARSS